MQKKGTVRRVIPPRTLRARHSHSETILERVFNRLSQMKANIWLTAMVVLLLVVLVVGLIAATYNNQSYNTGNAASNVLEATNLANCLKAFAAQKNSSKIFFFRRRPAARCGANTIENIRAIAARRLQLIADAAKQDPTVAIRGYDAAVDGSLLAQQNLPRMLADAGDVMTGRAISIERTGVHLDTFDETKCYARINGTFYEVAGVSAAQCDADSLKHVQYYLVDDLGRRVDNPLVAPELVLLSSGPGAQVKQATIGGSIMVTGGTEAQRTAIATAVTSVYGGRAAGKTLDLRNCGGSGPAGYSFADSGYACTELGDASLRLIAIHEVGHMVGLGHELARNIDYMYPTLDSAMSRLNIVNRVTLGMASATSVAVPSMNETVTAPGSGPWQITGACSNGDMFVGGGDAYCSIKSSFYIGSKYEGAVSGIAATLNGLSLRTTVGGLEIVKVGNPGSDGGGGGGGSGTGFTPKQPITGGSGTITLNCPSGTINVTSQPFAIPVSRGGTFSGSVLTASIPSFRPGSPYNLGSLGITGSSDPSKPGIVNLDSSHQTGMLWAEARGISGTVTFSVQGDFYGYTGDDMTHYTTSCSVTANITPPQQAPTTSDGAHAQIAISGHIEDFTVSDGTNINVTWYIPHEFTNCIVTKNATIIAQNVYEVNDTTRFAFPITQITTFAISCNTLQSTDTRVMVSKVTVTPSSAAPQPPTTQQHTGDVVCSPDPVIIALPWGGSTDFQTTLHAEQSISSDIIGTATYYTFAGPIVDFKNSQKVGSNDIRYNFHIIIPPGPGPHYTPTGTITMNAGSVGSCVITLFHNFTDNNFSEGPAQSLVLNNRSILTVNLADGPKTFPNVVGGGVPPLRLWTAADDHLLNEVNGYQVFSSTAYLAYASVAFDNGTVTITPKKAGVGTFYVRDSRPTPATAPIGFRICDTNDPSCPTSPGGGTNPPPGGGTGTQSLSLSGVSGSVGPTFSLTATATLALASGEVVKFRDNGIPIGRCNPQPTACSVNFDTATTGGWADGSNHTLQAFVVQIVGTNVEVAASNTIVVRFNKSGGPSPTDSQASIDSVTATANSTAHTVTVSAHGSNIGTDKIRLSLGSIDQFTCSSGQTDCVTIFQNVANGTYTVTASLKNNPSVSKPASVTVGTTVGNISHFECQNKQCVKVSGAGSSTGGCTSTSQPGDACSVGAGYQSEYGSQAGTTNPPPVATLDCSARINSVGTLVVTVGAGPAGTEIIKVNVGSVSSSTDAAGGTVKFTAGFPGSGEVTLVAKQGGTTVLGRGSCSY